MAGLHYDDACGRMSRFWAGFRTKSAISHNKNREVLAELTGIDSKDNASLIEFIGNLLQVPAQIRKDLERNGFDITPFEPPIKKMETLLGNLSLDGSPSSLRSSFDNSFIEQLNMVSAVLQKGSSIRTLTDEQRADLIAKVDELLQTVDEIELEDDDFERFVVDRLHSLRYAIQQYEFLGTDELIENVDKLFGGLVRQTPTIAQSPHKIGVVRKLFGLGTAVLFCIQLANQGFELTANMSDLLNAMNSVSDDVEADPGTASVLPSKIAKQGDGVEV